MAKVILRRDEAEDGYLPKVCMQCGAPATSQVSRKMNWTPSWVFFLILCGILPLFIVSLIVTKRMTLVASFCDEHKNHWSWRGQYALLSGLALAVIGLGGWFAVAKISQDLSGLVCFGLLVLGLAWLIACLVMDSSAIKPTEITDRNITLQSVCPAFVDAYRQVSDHRDQLRYPFPPGPPPPPPASDRYYDPNR